MNPDVSSLQGWVQSGILAAVIAWMLKYLVTDKLKTISDDIKSLKLAKEDISGEIRTLDVRVSRVEERCGISQPYNVNGGDRRACERGEG